MVSTISQIIQDPEFPEGEAWRRRAFETNEVIVKEGTTDRCIYLIKAGTLRVSGRVELPDHRHIQPGICDLGEGDLFGELSLFKEHPRTASVIAVTDGELFEIDGAHLSAYLDAHPEIGYSTLKDLFNMLTDRLSKANQRVESLFAWGLKAHGIDKHL